MLSTSILAQDSDPILTCRNDTTAFLVQVGAADATYNSWDVEAGGNLLMKQLLFGTTDVKLTALDYLCAAATDDGPQQCVRTLFPNWSYYQPEQFAILCRSARSENVSVRATCFNTYFARQPQSPNEPDDHIFACQDATTVPASNSVSSVSASYIGLFVALVTAIAIPISGF